MGLLVEDKILSWKDTQNYTEYYKTIALKQFVNIYDKYKNNIAKAFYWGYETEYMLVKKCGKDFKLNLKFIVFFVFSTISTLDIFSGVVSLDGK